MKTMKKLLAVALTVALVMSLFVTAFAQTVTYGSSDAPAVANNPATSDGKIVISNAAKGDTYTIYKLFDATYSGTDNSNVSYTVKAALKDVLNRDYFTVSTQSDGAGNFSVTRTKSGGEYVKTDAELLAYVESLLNDATVIASATANDTNLAFDKIPYGYYIIKNNVTDKAVVTIDSTNPVANVIDKNSGPDWDNTDSSGSPGKVILESDGNGGIQKASANEASLGEEITFDIGVYATNYDKDKAIYEYYINDILADGMTYVNNSLKVFVGGTEVTTPNYKIKYYDSENDPAASLGAASSFTVTLPWAESDGTSADGYNFFYKDKTASDGSTEIHVQYKAFLDPEKIDDVGTGAVANKNFANFDYTTIKSDGTPDNPHSDGWNPQTDTPNFEKPTKHTDTFSAQVTLTKVDATQAILAGAEFQLTTSDGAKYTLVTNQRFVQSDGGDYYKIIGATSDGAAQYTKADPNEKITQKVTSGGTTVDVTYDKYNTAVFEKKAGSTEYQKYALVTETSVVGEVMSDGAMKAFVNPSDGTLTFKGLGDGTYTLKETTVPAGYNRVDDITFTIGHKYIDTAHGDAEITDAPYTGENVSIEFTKGTNDQVSYNEATNTFYLTVENNKGVELPSTGGIGTKIFYTMGAVLVIGAGVMLVSKKRVGE